MATTGNDAYKTYETVTSTAQNFTASWVDLGNEIAVRGFNTVGVYLDIDINDTNNPRIRALAKLAKGGTKEYSLPIKTVGTSDVKIEDEYYEFNVDADQQIMFSVEVDDVVPYIQLQVQAGTVGSTAGQIEDCYVVKGNR